MNTLVFAWSLAGQYSSALDKTFDLAILCVCCEANKASPSVTRCEYLYRPWRVVAARLTAAGLH